MRSDLRLRLREITKSLSTQKTGVPGVTGVPSQPAHTVVHPTVTPSALQKDQQKQAGTPGTPCYTLENGGGDERYTSQGVTAGVAGCIIAPVNDPEGWFAHFEERAAIREYEGGFDRAEAERLALEETIAALGPQPATIH
ncbi:hypothetical protein ACLBXB_04145 [Methylobacterium mesophilicum]